MSILNKKRLIVNQLKSYCQNNNFSDVILGLSGGIDSALVLSLACESMGANHVHTIMMKTKYTSQKSIDLAQKIANLNHVNFQIIDIQPLVDNFLTSIPFQIKNNITEQNIQARVRGIIAMAYSNEYNYLLLACSNKSETAMGYCTLYGDTCGGICPIGDLFKTEVYEMAKLYNQEGIFIIPEEIISREPSAELTFNQKDSNFLPPYEILDRILKNHIFDNQTILKNEENLVQRIKKQYEKHAFKREQMPLTILTV